MSGPVRGELAYRAIRRVVDVLAAAALLLVLLPVVLALVLAIRLGSAGPAIFAQQREGRHMRPFTMYKLRTMYLDSDARLASLLARDAGARREWERFRRLREDPRMTGRLGLWLRRTSLDELPQLWNILRGDMSLIGPRPLELPVVDAFPLDERRNRASVRPGLTGLWQVSGRSETDLQTLWEIDAIYVRERSIRLDLDILARTPRAVLLRRGAY